MSLDETIKEMRELLTSISSDLEKAHAGNKAASQRVRTGTVKLEKLAKVYRKESIVTEKQEVEPKKAAPAKAKAAPKAAKPKPKTAVAKSKAKPLSVKRPTAKLPGRRRSVVQ